MKITVRFFAAMRDRIGKHRESLILDDDATLGDLVQHLLSKHPQLEPTMPNALFVVNHKMSYREAQLHDGDEVAILPPISGG